MKATKLIQNPIKNATNPFLKNKYADLGTVLDCVKPVLLELGVLCFQSCIMKDNQDVLDISTLFVDSESGATALFTTSVKLKDISPQGSMGAFTYGRRYGLKAAFGLADEDDDGNVASGKSEEKSEPVVSKTPEQAGTNIKKLFGKKE